MGLLLEGLLKEKKIRASSFLKFFTLQFTTFSFNSLQSRMTIITTYSSTLMSYPTMVYSDYSTTISMNVSHRRRQFKNDGDHNL